MDVSIYLVFERWWCKILT